MSEIKTEERVVSIPQVGGGVRWVALSADDADLVRRDRAMLDAVCPLAILDTAPGCADDWILGHPRGRAAILAVLAESRHE